MNLISEIEKLMKVKLIRNVYGLKQTGELMNPLLNVKLCAAGSTRLIHDLCVYVELDIEIILKTFVVII
jgi:hypothetical protein